MLRLRIPSKGLARVHCLRAPGEPRRRLATLPERSRSLLLLLSGGRSEAISALGEE